MLLNTVCRTFHKMPMCYSNIGHSFIRKKSSKSNPTSVIMKRIINRTLFGVTVGAIAYDGYNEFEVYGGISRFLRSLKIAAQISFDYSWNLYGISKNTEAYDEVRFLNIYKCEFLLKITGLLLLFYIHFLDH